MSGDVLYHYTCDHAAPLILADGVLQPHPIEGLVWLTDLNPAPRIALGLTSFSLKCDRMAHVFTVAASDDIQWWMDYRRTHPELRDKESCDGVMPMHWFVSEKPVPLLRQESAA